MINYHYLLLTLTVPKSYRDCVIRSYTALCKQKGTDSDIRAVIQYSIGGISYRFEKVLFMIATWVLKVKSSLKQ